MLRIIVEGDRDEGKTALAELVMLTLNKLGIPAIGKDEDGGDDRWAWGGPAVDVLARRLRKGMSVVEVVTRGVAAAEKVLEVGREPAAGDNLLPGEIVLGEPQVCNLWYLGQGRWQSERPNLTSLPKETDAHREVDLERLRSVVRHIRGANDETCDAAFYIALLPDRPRSAYTILTLPCPPDHEETAETLIALWRATPRSVTMYAAADLQDLMQKAACLAQRARDEDPNVKVEVRVLDGVGG
jgi:hypothetical protein